MTRADELAARVESDEESFLDQLRAGRDSGMAWARKAGLLGVTSVAYQFRHESYQRWLAARPTPHNGPP